MRQLIARIDDDVHARLKARAAAEGRSLNALVVAALTAAAGEANSPRAVRARARSTGRLVLPPSPERPPSRDEAIAATRGAGRATSEALAAERAAR
ncbi:MAG: FitA-like ribbon-helix-helix domain-containing protein [Streptosporangiaceae bacterium]